MFVTAKGKMAKIMVGADKKQRMEGIRDTCMCVSLTLNGVLIYIILILCVFLSPMSLINAFQQIASGRNIREIEEMRNEKVFRLNRQEVKDDWYGFWRHFPPWIIGVHVDEDGYVDQMRVIFN